MDAYTLVERKKGATRAAPIHMFSDPSALKSLTSDLGWKVYREMAVPSCPMDIAKKLKVHEQKVYYYVRNFKTAGLIREVRKEQRHGTVAHFYQAKDLCMGLMASDAQFEIARSSAPSSRRIEPFVHDGKLNCRIIVGSPDPHGPFKARASDSCCAIDFALFLGSFTDGNVSPNYKLDVEVRSRDMGGNLVLIGGPAVNTIMAKVNDSLPVQIERGNEISSISKVTGKRYFDDEIGFICIAKNPFNPTSKILILAGKRFQGTRAAVIAFTRHMDEILKGNKFDRSVQARVVKGFDLDSDGIIDSVEFLE